MTKAITYGLHAVQALLEHSAERVTRIVILQGREDAKIKALIQQAKEHQIDIKRVPRAELDKLSQHENHQGVLAYLSTKSSHLSEDTLFEWEGRITDPVFLILDGVQDPHNLGACLRTADAAGVYAVIVPRDKAVGITPTVSKVACGAAETVPFVQVTNLARTMKQLQEKGVWIYGAAAEAKEVLYQARFKGPIAIVLGAEGTGLRRLTQEHCDVLLKIPMQGTVSSLNVSVATGLFLFEVVRQRSL